MKCSKIVVIVTKLSNNVLDKNGRMPKTKQITKKQTKIIGFWTNSRYHAFFFGAIIHELLKCRPQESLILAVAIIAEDSFIAGIYVMYG